MKLPEITEPVFVAMWRSRGYEGWGFTDGHKSMLDAVEDALHFDDTRDFRIVQFDPDGVIRDVTEDACDAVTDLCVGEPPMLPTYAERDHARYLWKRDEVA